ncbi:hypothetical protein H7R52_11705, partial [Weissella confusa]|nr:hypothetical protein [Weissella confusa]
LTKTKADLQTIANEFAKQGYKIVSVGDVPGVFDNDDKTDQAVDIHLTHRVDTVDPKTPGVPDQPISNDIPGYTFSYVHGVTTGVYGPANETTSVIFYYKADPQAVEYNVIDDTDHKNLVSNALFEEGVTAGASTLDTYDVNGNNLANWGDKDVTTTPDKQDYNGQARLVVSFLDDKGHVLAPDDSSLAKSGVGYTKTSDVLNNVEFTKFLKDGNNQGLLTDSQLNQLKTNIALASAGKDSVGIGAIAHIFNVNFASNDTPNEVPDVTLNIGKEIQINLDANIDGLTAMESAVAKSLKNKGVGSYAIVQLKDGSYIVAYNIGNPYTDYSTRALYSGDTKSAKNDETGSFNQDIVQIQHIVIEQGTVRSVSLDRTYTSLYVPMTDKNGNIVASAVSAPPVASSAIWMNKKGSATITFGNAAIKGKLEFTVQPKATNGASATQKLNTASDKIGVQSSFQDNNYLPGEMSSDVAGVAKQKFDVRETQGTLMNGNVALGTYTIADGYFSIKLTQDLFGTSISGLTISGTSGSTDVQTTVEAEITGAVNANGEVIANGGNFTQSDQWSTARVDNGYSVTVTIHNESGKYKNGDTIRIPIPTTPVAATTEVSTDKAVTDKPAVQPQATTQAPAQSTTAPVADTTQDNGQQATTDTNTARTWDYATDYQVSDAQVEPAKTAVSTQPDPSAATGAVVTPTSATLTTTDATTTENADQEAAAKPVSTPAATTPVAP